LTVSGRPLRSLPSSAAMALSASSLFGISTKPRPGYPFLALGHL
jgi:hypothetical protein